MADRTTAETGAGATRLALAVAFGVTLLAVAGVLLALAFSGPPDAATGALSLGLGVVVVAGSIAAVAARTDDDGAGSN